MASVHVRRKQHWCFSQINVQILGLLLRIVQSYFDSLMFEWLPELWDGQEDCNIILVYILFFAIVLAVLIFSFLLCCAMLCF